MLKIAFPLCVAASLTLTPSVAFGEILAMINYETKSPESLLLAILAVLPKYRPLRLDSDLLPGHFNLLFFGHFAELSRERFLREVAAIMKPDGTVYDTMARDLFALGYYLAHYKYRYLRLAYLFFLTGFVMASLVQIWRLVAG